MSRTINIKVPAEDSISNKEFYVIVKAIEEITGDLNHQETIIDTLVDEKFAYLGKNLEEEISLEEIAEKTKERAENILSEKIFTLEARVGILTNQMKRVEEEYQEKGEEDKKITRELINDEREKSAEIYAQDKLFEKRVRHVLVIATLIGVIGWQLIDFFVMKNQKNIVWSAVETMLQNTPLEGEKTNIFMLLGSAIISIVLTVWCVELLRIFFSQERIESFKGKMKRKFLKKRGM